MSQLNRRSFITTAASAATVSFLPPLAFADDRRNARFVLVILRGALDGLSAMPAYGDGNFASIRGELAITAPANKLDGMFGLHPSLTHAYERYQAQELIAFHAVASPYRERSHFDGQDLLENGTTQPKTAHDGWLNRLLPGIAHGRSTEQYALALAQNVPLVLRGDSRVNSWAPSGLPETDSDTLQRIADLYATDQYFASRLAAALSVDSMAGEGGMNGGGKREPLNAMGPIASAAGRFLAAPDGPRIAVIEVSGWDTHANQGAERGQLGNRLRGLDQGIEDLRTTLGPAWRDTAVMIVTEFGRTVAVNGTRGTDHGTATCAFLVGGAVVGGRVLADWPGLARGDLYQSRDLQPTLDLRSVFKGVLAAHLGASEKDLDTRVFPESRSVKPLEGLVRFS